MGWDAKNGKRYYSRSRRVNGRVVREYVGGGAAGEQAAAEDARRREQCRLEAVARRAGQQQWQEADAALQSFCDLTDLLVRAALLSAGYHQYNRGEWRRRRRVDNHQPPADPRPPNP
jgi:hypothetical protein